MGPDDNGATSAHGGSKAAPPPFFLRFFRLAGAYWVTEDKWRVWGLMAVLIGLTIALVAIPIQINLWNARLFDALEQRSMDRFYILLVQIALILAASMAVTSIHLVVKRRIQLGWRRWLTRKIQDNWMAMGHHYQLNHLPGEHDNPDGRIAEDIRTTTESAMDLAHSLFYCLLLLMSFIDILWRLSEGIAFTVAGTTIPVPGFMVWVALIYTSVASGLALWMGQPLILATNNRQTAEANFRFGLVRARENSEAIALLHGEVGERRRFTELFRGIEGAWNRQTSSLTRLFLFTSGYSVLSTAFPVLVAAPRYISGAISLGHLMQSAQAFQQLTSALSWPVDNMQKVAEWRASVERVLALNDALEALRDDATRPDAHAIVVEKSDATSLFFHDLTIADADGTVVTEGFSAEITPGERVLIGGDPGTAVKLFKVMAGLWPWGKGTVHLPRDATLFFMPQRPYMPIGSLRGVLAYPSTSDSFSEAAMSDALIRVGLDHLIERLRQKTSWDQALTAGEQQRLSFARLLLHRPRWICLQEATDALDPEGERRLMQLLLDEFPHATVLTVGFHGDLDAYHQRKLTMSATPRGKIMVKETRQGWTTPPNHAGGSWGGRLLDQFRRRGERRGLTATMGKHGDWRS